MSPGFGAGSAVGAAVCEVAMRRIDYDRKDWFLFHLCFGFMETKFKVKAIERKDAGN